MLNRIKKYFSKDPVPAIDEKRIAKLENRTELFGNQSRVDHIQILEKLNSLEAAIKVIEGIQTTEAKPSKKVQNKKTKKIQKKKGSPSNPHDLLSLSTEDLHQYFDSRDLVDKALKKATEPAKQPLVTAAIDPSADDPVYLQKQLENVKPAKPDDVMRISGRPLGGNVETEDRLLKIEDVMATLKVGRSTIHKLISSGELPGVKVGTSRRILLKDLNNYIENL